MRTKTRVLTESSLQREVLSYLRENNYLFWRNNNVPAIAHRKRSKGTLSGLPDIVGVYRGTFYGLEVKLPKRKLSTAQQLIKLAIEKEGGYYFIVDSLKVVKNLFGVNETLHENS